MAVFRVTDEMTSLPSVVGTLNYLTDWVAGGHEDDSAEILFQDWNWNFSSGGPCEQLWHGQEYPLFDVVPPAFLLPTTASPILQGALKDGFGEALVACDMPEP